jgi:hypothetical protein
MLNNMQTLKELKKEGKLTEKLKTNKRKRKTEAMNINTKRETADI